ncbi:MAG: SBBP repeat-containing protein [Saprospiraceae bacterium]
MKNHFTIQCAAAILLMFSCKTYGPSPSTQYQYYNVLQQSWVNYQGKQDILPPGSRIAIDDWGDVYVAGGSSGAAGTSNKITLTKYDATGKTVWNRTPDSSNDRHDYPTDLAMDPAGNVCVIGGSTGADGTMALLTIKYDRHGNALWSRQYQKGKLNRPKDLGTDVQGNVYVLGETKSQNSDYLMLKYNSKGDLLWEKLYDNGSDDLPTGIKIDKEGNVIVTGQSMDKSNDYATLKLNSNGVVLWVKRYDGAMAGLDGAIEISVDSQDNIYVTGNSTETENDLDITTIKYSKQGEILWKHVYDNAHLDDVVGALKIDNNQDVLMTGASSMSNTAPVLITLKVNGVLGTLAWEQTYYGVGTAKQGAAGIVVDKSNNLYIAGNTNNGKDQDFVLIKYSTKGIEEWHREFNGPDDGPETVEGIAINRAGDLYATGQESNQSGDFRTLTVKYGINKVIVPPNFNNEPPSPSFTYFQNKGQIIDTDGKAKHGIKFYTNNRYPETYLSDSTISYVFMRLDSSDAPDTLSRIDLRFVGKSAQRSAAHPFSGTEGVLHYYQAHIPEGRTNINGHNRIVYPEIYPRIDLHLSSGQTGLRYSFVTNTGGNARAITLQFSGQEKLGLDGAGNLTVATAIGALRLKKPMAFQLGRNNNLLPVPKQPTYLDLGGGIIGFDLADYNYSLPLVLQIDEDLPPSTLSSGDLEWSTYYGGTGYEEFWDVKTDNSGLAYVTGFNEAGNFPVLNFMQGTNLGFRDAIMLKFNNTTRVYATYYGGADLETGYSVAPDAAGAAVVMGRTWSQNLPLLNPGGGAYFDNVNACTGFTCEDMFVMKLNPNGTLNWGTYYGGTGGAVMALNKAGEMVMDNLGSFYIVGSEGGNTTTLLNPGGGAYFSNSGTGLITKFSASGQLLWATKFPCQYISGAKIDAAGNLYITGTAQSGLPIVNPGGGAFIQSAPAGLHDGFVAKFNNSRQLIWSTYFGGSDTDLCRGITTDNTGSIYIAGETMSTDFPVLHPGGAAFFQPTFQGTGTNINFFRGDAFFAKFNPSGSLYGSTYLGGVFNDGGSHLTTDNNNTVYLVGSSASNSLPFPAANPTGWFAQTNLNNTPGIEDDGLIMAFKPDMSLNYSTYFGGNGFDVAYSAHAYQSSKLYIVGATGSTAGFPITNYGSGYNQASCGCSLADGFIARLDIAPCSLMGAPCNDNNNCTINDAYDRFCNCTGTLLSTYDLMVADDPVTDLGLQPNNGNLWAGEIWNCHSSNSCPVNAMSNPEYKTSGNNYLSVKIKNVGCNIYSSGNAVVHLYWTIGRTGEIWDHDWVLSASNQINGHIAGREITPAGGLPILSSIPAGAFTILEQPWIAPNPANFNMGPSPMLCFLARTESPQDPITGEAIGPTAIIANNVQNSNNIATINAMLVDLVANINNPNPNLQTYTILINNPNDHEALYNLDLSETGMPDGRFFTDGSIEVIFDSVQTKNFASVRLSPNVSRTGPNSFQVKGNDVRHEIKNIRLGPNENLVAGFRFSYAGNSEKTKHYQVRISGNYQGQEKNAPAFFYNIRAQKNNH